MAEERKEKRRREGEKMINWKILQVTDNYVIGRYFFDYIGSEFYDEEEGVKHLGDFWGWMEGIKAWIEGGHVVYRLPEEEYNAPEINLLVCEGRDFFGHFKRYNILGALLGKTSEDWFVNLTPIEVQKFEALGAVVLSR